jgi:hypothetical protein
MSPEAVFCGIFAFGGFVIGGIVGDHFGRAVVQKEVDACRNLAAEVARQRDIREWRRDCEEQVRSADGLSGEGRVFFREQCVRQKEAEVWK